MTTDQKQADAGREAFEAWAKLRGFECRKSDGRYHSSLLQDYWIGFQVGREYENQQRPDLRAVMEALEKIANKTGLGGKGQRSYGQPFYKDMAENMGKLAQDALALLTTPQATPAKGEPVDTAFIAHQLEYQFPQISLSALSDIIEYFRPYLATTKQESIKAPKAHPDKAEPIERVSSLGHAWEQFKQINDARLREIEQRATLPDKADVVDERQAFERLATEMGYRIERRSNGVYDSSHTDLMRTTWNAALAYDSASALPPTRDDSGLVEELVSRLENLRTLDTYNRPFPLAPGYNEAIFKCIEVVCETLARYKAQLAAGAV